MKHAHSFPSASVDAPLAAGQVSILSLNPADSAQCQAFYALNEAWVTKYFRMEPEDIASLSNPKSYILDRGGAIFLASLQGEYVGAIALMRMDDEDGKPVYELAKMAVRDGLQGQGIGRKLGSRLLAEAQTRGAAKIYIISNTRLESAIHLYRSLGFTDSPAAKHLRYERGDITLELTLPLATQDRSA